MQVRGAGAGAGVVLGGRRLRDPLHVHFGAVWCYGLLWIGTQLAPPLLDPVFTGPRSARPSATSTWRETTPSRCGPIGVPYLLERDPLRPLPLLLCCAAAVAAANERCHDQRSTSSPWSDPGVRPFPCCSATLPAWRAPPSAASSARRPSRVRAGHSLLGVRTLQPWVAAQSTASAWRTCPANSLFALFAGLPALNLPCPPRLTLPPPAEDWNTSSVKPSQAAAKEPALA